MQQHAHCLVVHQSNSQEVGRGNPGLPTRGRSRLGRSSQAGFEGFRAKLKPPRLKRITQCPRSAIRERSGRKARKNQGATRRGGAKPQEGQRKPPYAVQGYAPLVARSGMECSGRAVPVCTVARKSGADEMSEGQGRTWPSMKRRSSACSSGESTFSCSSSPCGQGRKPEAACPVSHASTSSLPALQIPEPSGPATSTRRPCAGPCGGLRSNPCAICAKQATAIAAEAVPNQHVRKGSPGARHKGGRGLQCASRGHDAYAPERAHSKLARMGASRRVLEWGSGCSGGFSPP